MASVVELDVQGVRCPIPVIRLAQAATTLPAGTEVVVVVTDPAAVHDVPAWARLRGHTWLGVDPEEVDRQDTVSDGEETRPAGQTGPGGRTVPPDDDPRPHPAPTRPAAARPLRLRVRLGA